MLGRFGLSGHHHLTPICKLSGGQKARVVFTSISLMQPHILLLDGGCGRRAHELLNLTRLWAIPHVAGGQIRVLVHACIWGCTCGLVGTPDRVPFCCHLQCWHFSPPCPSTCPAEPTNHLDMQSIDALCDAVEEFEGGVIVISHDAQLLARLCADEERSQVLVVEDGMIRQYNGDFDDYRTELIKEIQAEMDED